MGVMMMKQVKIEKTKDVLYIETLDNGLQIFMVPKNTVNTTMVSFNVKYGAIHTSFIPLGEKEMISVPLGIAHFLEHKMFEQESGIDPMLFFAQNGADVNAYTSLFNTAYYFSCSTRLRENLNYLLDFVQSPYFTDENVLKEKGIIEEEIKMYDDDPYSFLSDQIRLNAFINHPIRYNVAGEVKDIRSITKEQLYKCYHTFYHPSNMFLVITGKFDVEEVLNIVKVNQQAKKFDKQQIIAIKKIKEEDEVLKEYEEKEMNVVVPKICVGIKIPLKGIKIPPKIRNIYLSIIFDCLFGTTSTFNEEMREKGFLLSNIAFDSTFTEDHFYQTMSADTEHTSELLDAIEKQLLNISIDEKDFSDKIKMFISNNIYVFESVENTNVLISQNLILYGEYEANIRKIIDNLSMEGLNNFISKLNLNNKSVYIIKSIQK